MHPSGIGWLLVCAALTLLQAQPPTGEIRLLVRDPSGAPMIADGRLESLASGTARTFRTDPQGAFTFPVPYGRYRLELHKRGFITRPEIFDVASPDPVSLTVTLSLATTAFNIDVVGGTPLPGTDLSLDDIPAPVQTATQSDLDHSGAANLADFLSRRLSGVHLNELQGNPFQPDLNYRGYTASPLLGTPQGVSIYMDGVRLNQPFGDVVSWDLIPQVAIAEVTLMPGSNPLFGLNTLGGALSLRTRDGASNPGTTLELSGGSFARKAASLEHGHATAHGLDWFLAANFFFDDGWRQSSPSNVRQFFGRIGWQRSRTFIGLSLAYANNALNGNGLQEQRLLAARRSSVYTLPDITANRSPFLNLTARHTIGTALLLSGNAWYRYIRTATLNGDLNDDSLDQSVYQPNAPERAALTAAGYSGFPLSGADSSNTPFPFWRCIAQALLADEPDEKCNGLLHRSRTQQHDYGVSAQLTRTGRHQLTAGAAFSGSTVDFGQSTQFGYLDSNRAVVPVNAFDNPVHLHGRITTASVFAADTFSLHKLTFTLSGRYNRTHIDNHDRLQPGGGPGSLDGRYTFPRLNPAAGLTFTPIPAMTAYAGYSEGSRAPTSIELGCADPLEPCKLPNAMAGDPPLRQVVTRTAEAGLRGHHEDLVHWTLGFFHADNRDDILFVASPQTGFGYFRNFGKTRRQGLELDLSSRIRRVTPSLGYTFLDATYRSAESIASIGNSAGVGGLLEIRPGDRIPLVPQHLLKANANLQATTRLSIDLALNAFSSAYARGNENNLHQPDGKYFLGPGVSPGYAVFHLGARYRLHPRVELIAQVNNLFDRHYSTAAQLGVTGFTATGTFLARPLPAVDGQYPLVHSTFYAPAAPRGAWLSLRVRI